MVYCWELQVGLLPPTVCIGCTERLRPNPAPGGNDPLLESLIQQRADSVAGTLLLFVGFLLQWFVSLGMHSDQSGKILFIFLVVMSLIYVSFLRNKLISLQVSRARPFDSNS